MKENSGESENCFGGKAEDEDKCMPCQNIQRRRQILSLDFHCSDRVKIEPMRWEERRDGFQSGLSVWVADDWKLYNRVSRLVK